MFRVCFFVGAQRTAAAIARVELGTVESVPVFFSTIKISGRGLVFQSVPADLRCKNIYSQQSKHSTKNKQTYIQKEHKQSGEQIM